MKIIRSVYYLIEIQCDYYKKFLLVVKTSFPHLHILQDRTKWSIWYLCALLLIDTCQSKSQYIYVRIKRFSSTLTCSFHIYKILKGSHQLAKNNTSIYTMSIVCDEKSNLLQQFIKVYLLEKKDKWWREVN